MDDITPLNLEDSPKLFGLRYDQLIACLISLVISTQFYSLMNPVMIGSHDLRLYIAIFFGLVGPTYSLVTVNHTVGHWDAIINFYMMPQVYIPGPDPNPVRFLTDEELPGFLEVKDDEWDLD